MIKEIQVKKSISKEYYEVFQNLDEAIVLFSRGSITFYNQIFNKILKNVKIIK